MHLCSLSPFTILSVAVYLLYFIIFFLFKFVQHNNMFLEVYFFLNFFTTYMVYDIAYTIDHNKVLGKVFIHI